MRKSNAVKLKKGNQTDMAEKEQTCYLCNEDCRDYPHVPRNKDAQVLWCDNCEAYQIANGAIEQINTYVGLSDEGYVSGNLLLVGLKHHIHELRRYGSAIPMIWTTDVTNIFRKYVSGSQPPAPEPPEQKNRLVSLLAREARKTPIVIKFDKEGMKIGSLNENEFVSVVNDMYKKGLIFLAEHPHPLEETKTTILSPDGWEYYEGLKKSGFDSNKAFMAMAFGKEDLNRNVREHFRDTVKMAGFELVFADEIQQTGFIDEHIRDAIRASAFVIADLTHGNQGVYFEAGFADGLGRPVIYTCNKEVWDKKRIRNKNVHFDVNHQRVLKWDPSNLSPINFELEETIKAAKIITRYVT